MVGSKKIAKYIDLLLQWNRVHNITRITEPELIMQKHIQDSLTLAEYIKFGSIVDVGSGAGLPGIPLAINNSDLKITLIESNYKKCIFLERVVNILKLDNVNIINQRVENVKLPNPPDWIVCRAFAALEKIVHSVYHLCGANTKVVAMKGNISRQEINDLRNNCSKMQIERCELVTLPGLNHVRNLIFLKL